MIRTDTVFRTIDGKIHSNLEAAENHVIDQVCELVDNFMPHPGEGPCDLTRSQKNKVIKSMFPSIYNVRNFYDALTKIIGDGDHPKDDPGQPFLD